MKEIKVATLTDEEIKGLREISKKKEKIETMIAQVLSAKAALWKKIGTEHNLISGDHYIVGDSIYRQEVE